MAGEFLPPVVALLTSNTTSFDVGIDSAIAKSSELGLAFDAMTAEEKVAAIELGQLATAAEVTATQYALAMDKMAADTASLAAKMELADMKAIASTEALGTKITETATITGAQSKISSAALIGTTVAAGLVVGASVDMASKFEVQMTRLYTAAGAPKQVVMDNYHAVLDLATSVGQSGVAMAEALYHPISAGLDFATALNVVKYSAEEARISGAKLDDTTYSLSSVMKAFNQSADDAGPTMAKLNAIVGEGDMKFQDFNASIKNWAPTAAAMGISIESMGSGLAYLTDRGNSAEVAATRMTMGLTMMTTPSKQAASLLIGLGVASSDVTASSSLMEAALHKAGVTQNQLAEDLKQPDGLYVALSDLKSHLEQAGVAGSEADSTLAKIFGGGRSDKAILSLMQNLDGLKEKYNSIVTDSAPSKFEQNWKDASSTFSATMKDLGAFFTNLGITIGTKLLPALSDLAKGFMNTFQWLGDHKEVLVAIGSATIPLIVAAIWLAVPAVWALAAAFWATGIPELMIIFAALGFAIYMLVTHLKEVGHFFTWLWNTVWKWTSDRVTDIVNFIKSQFTNITDWIKQRWTDIDNFFARMWNNVWRWCSDRITDIRNFIVSQFHNVIDWIKSSWTDVSNFWARTWNNVWRWCSDRVTDIRNFVVSTFHDIVAGIKIEWNDFSDFWAKVWNNIWRWCSDRITDIRNFIVSQFHNVVTGITAEWNSFADFWTRLWNNVWKWCSDRLTDVTDFIGAVPGKVKGFFGDAGTWLVNAGKAILDGFLSGLKAAWNAVTSFIGGIGSWISAHKGPIEVDAVLLSPHGNAIMMGLLGGLKAGAPKVSDFLDNFTTKLGNTAASSDLKINGSILGAGNSTATANKAAPQPIQVNITMNPRDVAVWLQTGTLRYNLRNPTNGLAVKGA